MLYLGDQDSLGFEVSIQVIAKGHDRFWTQRDRPAMHPFSISTALVGFGLFSGSVQALQYYISNPAQCQPLNLTWSDAKGTLHLLLMPVRRPRIMQRAFSDIVVSHQVVETSQGFIQNITLPSTATSPYQFTNFTQPAGMDFMAVMWDDEGYPGTGVTDVLSTCYRAFERIWMLMRAFVVAVGSSDDTSCLRA